MWNVRKSRGSEFETSSEAGRSQKRKRTIWIWGERLLLAFGIALLAFYGAVRIEGILGSRAALEKFTALNSSASTANRSGGEHMNSLRDTDSSEVDFAHWDEHRVQAYVERFAGQSSDPLGVLLIPKVHLEVPLFDGTDGLTLNHGVGRIAGTARPGEQGNIGIAGHRDSFFRGLKDVVVGDAIELKTLNGTDTYVVNELKIVTPDDVAVLQARSVPSLTLVTCYPFYFIGSAPQRYIVTASLTRGIKSGPENRIFDPPSQISSSKRRNNEHSE